MTNTQSLGTIEATNPVLAVAPLKEETEMLRATDKITALYCRLSVEDLKEDKKGGKEDESNSIQNQKMILLQYAKEHRFPNPTFFVDMKTPSLIQFNDLRRLAGRGGKLRGQGG